MKFHPATIYSITSGRLFCGMDDLQRILEHVTGRAVFTHMIPDAMRFASPILRESFPEIALQEHPTACDDKAKMVREFSAALAEKFGDEIEVDGPDDVEGKWSHEEAQASYFSIFRKPKEGT